ncbi:FecR family protein [Flavihumibacter fluvii]|uniref:FecR family protein n=1 Tax=Flavihumibacter fluvii TaxID=2838157 RepID=UPI001BDF37C8|nr:FecR domain-containing protein [Flavihumibacter fluvii]ULQ53554.1 FecR domain-containing protein [Flavihumibacter fluvii]
MSKPLPYQTDKLLVKFLLGEATPTEAEEASNWISASRENETYFHQFRQVWEKSLPMTKNIEIDEDSAWTRFQERVKNTSSLQGNPKQEIHRIPALLKSPLFRLAASVIIAITTFAIAYFSFYEFSNPRQLQLVTNLKAETQRLQDGSTVILNKHSSLNYPSRFKGEERVVTLHGEGFFSIQPNKKKPFVVKVNDITIKVVGTSFNIREVAGRTEVIVESGIVQVIGRRKTIELHPKERVVIDPADSSLQKEQQKDFLYNYYRTKSFTCDNTPLWKLVEVLNEAYEVQIEIANPVLRDLPLTTTFEEEPIDTILNIIAQTLEIKVEKTGNIIILK